MRAGLVGWKTHYLRPIIPYYQTLGVALVITPRQISRPPDAFIKRLLTSPTITSDDITRLPWLESQQSLAPAGGVSSLEPSPLPTNIQAAVFSWREIGRYEAAEMREVCRYIVGVWRT